MTGIEVSVSRDSASLASTHSRRSRCRASAAAGSAGSRSKAASPTRSVTTSRTCSKTQLSIVGAAEVVEAVGPAEQLEPVRAAPQDRGVEGAAAEVVDADHVAGAHPLGAGVADRRGLRLGDEHRLVDAGLQQHLGEPVAPVLRPARPGRSTATVTGGPPSRWSTTSSTQRSSVAIRLSGLYATPPSTTGVASPSRALNSRTVRPRRRRRALLGRVADEDAAVRVQHDDRRREQFAVPERHHLRLVAAQDRRRRVRRAQVDPEPVVHVTSPCRVAAGRPRPPATSVARYVRFVQAFRPPDGASGRLRVAQTRDGPCRGVAGLHVVTRRAG